MPDGAPLYRPLAHYVGDARTLTAVAFATRHGGAFFVSEGGLDESFEKPVDTVRTTMGVATANLQRSAPQLEFIVYPLR
jgi:pSer/pThr/pTyr-binding forkhead associated (FHA) protein